MGILDLLPAKYKQDLIVICAGYEGLRGLGEDGKYYPYQGKADKPGLMTIGRGHLLTDEDKRTERFKDGLTLDQVNQLFIDDLEVRAKYVHENICKVSNSRHFVGILSSFYNCPAIWDAKNSPLKLYKTGALRLCLEKVMLYYNSNGQPQYGLVRRRATECLYILTGTILFGNKDVAQEQKLYDTLRPLINFSLSKFKLRKGIK